MGPRNLNFKVPGAEKANFVGPGGPGGLGILTNINLNVTIPTDFLKADPAVRIGGKGQRSLTPKFMNLGN